jgi:hypothetical protein
LYVLCVEADVSDALYGIDGGVGLAYAAVDSAKKHNHEAAKQTLQKFGHLANDRPVKLLLGHGGLFGLVAKIFLRFFIVI